MGPRGDESHADCLDVPEGYRELSLPSHHPDCSRRNHSLQGPAVITQARRMSLKQGLRTCAPSHRLLILTGKTHCLNSAPSAEPEQASVGLRIQTGKGSSTELCHQTLLSGSRLCHLIVL